MTRLPTESRDYKGLKGPDYPDYKLGPLCSVPDCGRLADHAHHLVRRSELAGAFHWVRMPDGTEVGNVIGLCYGHHEDVTVNKASILWDGENFNWDAPTSETVSLTPQPPHHHPDVDEALDAEFVPESVEDERPICPGCGRKLPKPKIDGPQEDKRPRGTFAVAIPMDERENGADVLDDMLEGIREKLDTVGIVYSEHSNAKYYVLSTGLGLLLSHFDAVVADA